MGEESVWLISKHLLLPCPLFKLFFWNLTSLYFLLLKTGKWTFPFVNIFVQGKYIPRNLPGNDLVSTLLSSSVTQLFLHKHPSKGSKHNTGTAVQLCSALHSSTPGSTGQKCKGDRAKTLPAPSQTVAGKLKPAHLLSPLPSRPVHQKEQCKKILLSMLSRSFLQEG